MSEILRTPEEWQEVLDVKILDPDGWRMADAPPWDQPISQNEFMMRFAMCTVMVSPTVRELWKRDG